MKTGSIRKMFSKKTFLLILVAMFTLIAYAAGFSSFSNEYGNGSEHCTVASMPQAPVLDSVELSSETVPEGTMLTVTVRALSNSPVNWINRNFDGPHGNIYGGSHGTSYFVEVSPGLWEYSWTDTVSKYAPSGTYYYTDISVKNAGMMASVSWPDPLVVEILNAADTGTLVVNLLPSLLRETGAKWSVNGGERWHESGSRVLPAGIYTISFTDVQGWDAPAEIAGIEIMPGEVSVQNVNYGEVLDVVPEDGLAVLYFCHHPLAVEIYTGESGSIIAREYSTTDTERPAGLSTIGLFLQIDCSSALAGYPSKILVNYDKNILPAITSEETLRIMRYRPTTGEWELLPGGVDTDKCVVWAETVSFSLFGVFGDTIFKYGDVDMNGQVDVGDAIKVLRHIVGLDVLDEQSLARAKVSGDEGEPSVADAILILRYIVGLIVEFPVG